MTESDTAKAPKHAISNGWVIGFIPHDLVGDIDDILAAAVSRFRFFS